MYTIFSEDCNSSTDSLNISAPLYVQTNFDCSMSTMSNDETSSSLNGGISGMMSDVDSGLTLSSTTDEIQDHSSMMDFQTLLQQLPTTSAPQNVRHLRIYRNLSLCFQNIFFNFLIQFLIYYIFFFNTDYHRRIWRNQKNQNCSFFLNLQLHFDIYHWDGYFVAKTLALVFYCIIFCTNNI